MAALVPLVQWACCCCCRSRVCATDEVGLVEVATLGARGGIRGIRLMASGGGGMSREEGMGMWEMPPLEVAATGGAGCAWLEGMSAADKVDCQVCLGDRGRDGSRGLHL
jgi:hypothetical protein